MDLHWQSITLCLLICCLGVLVTIVGGVCNFLSSVSLEQKFEATNRSVLQLSFIWQAKQNTSSRSEGRLTQKKHRVERRSLRLNFGSSFDVLSLPAEPAGGKLGQPGGLLVSAEVLTPVLGPFFVPFSRAFLYLWATSILDLFFLI